MVQNTPSLHLDPIKKTFSTIKKNLFQCGFAWYLQYFLKTLETIKKNLFVKMITCHQTASLRFQWIFYGESKASSMSSRDSKMTSSKFNTMSELNATICVNRDTTDTCNHQHVLSQLNRYFGGMVRGGMDPIGLHSKRENMINKYKYFVELLLIAST